MKLQCEELTKTIMECFDNSLDDRFSPKERKNFLTQGKKLRGLLVQLLGAKFTKGTAKVSGTNKKIKELWLRSKSYWNGTNSEDKTY